MRALKRPRQQGGSIRSSEFVRALARRYAIFVRGCAGKICPPDSINTKMTTMLHLTQGRSAATGGLGPMMKVAAGHPSVRHLSKCLILMHEIAQLLPAPKRGFDKYNKLKGLPMGVVAEEGLEPPTRGL